MSSVGFTGKKAELEAPSNPSILHFNNAGCSLPAPGVQQAVQTYIDAEAKYGGYAVIERPEFAAQLERPYSALASLLNCEPSSIAVVNSATAAWQRVFFGLPLWLPGSCIITSVAEYGSNFIAYLQVKKRYGTAVHVLRETSSGALDTEHLRQLLENRTPSGLTLVSISHVPTSSGRVYDARAVGDAVAAYPDVVYLLDACQSVGQMPVDVQRIGCHFLSATGRKFLRAPRGTGFLYASPTALADGRLEPAAMDVRGAQWCGEEEYRASASARRYEEYELSFAAKAGLGVACDHVLEMGIESIWERVQSLAGGLRHGLEQLPGVHVQDVGDTLCGIVTFTVDGKTPEDIKQALKAATCGGKYESGMNVSVSRKWSTWIDFHRRGLDDVVRASPHYYNTDEEVEDFLAALASSIQQ